MSGQFSIFTSGRLFDRSPVVFRVGWRLAPCARGRVTPCRGAGRGKAGRVGWRVAPRRGAGGRRGASGRRCCRGGRGWRVAPCGGAIGRRGRHGRRGRGGRRYRRGRGHRRGHGCRRGHGGRGLRGLLGNAPNVIDENLVVPAQHRGDASIHGFLNFLADVRFDNTDRHIDDSGDINCDRNFHDLSFLKGNVIVGKVCHRSFRFSDRGFRDILARTGCHRV